jgi:hypothetical protein
MASALETEHGEITEGIIFGTIHIGVERFTAMRIVELSCGVVKP